MYPGSEASLTEYVLYNVQASHDVTLSKPNTVPLYCRPAGFLASIIPTDSLHLISFERKSTSSSALLTLPKCTTSNVFAPTWRFCLNAGGEARSAATEKTRSYSVSSLPNFSKENHLSLSFFSQELYYHITTDVLGFL